SVAFGPYGRLYVTDFVNLPIKMFDGVTGAFVGQFAGTGQSSPTNLNFHLPPRVQPDLSGDGKADILFFDPTSRGLAIWKLGGTTGVQYQGGAPINFSAAVGWTPVGTADFNDDLKPDLLFWNSSTGGLAVWYLNGTSYAGG